MKSFRNPLYLERYEDVVFDLETALATPANNGDKKKVGYRFVADNTGEATPFDWYNSRFSVDFKVDLRANGGNINAGNNESGIVNGSGSFIKKFSILANAIDVYSCDNANHVVNIKNLLEYNPSCAKTVATNDILLS